jgi:hypothetical protein
VTIDGKYEYTGEVRVWAPGMATELLQTATNDGNAVLALSELRKLEDGGKTLAGAIRLLAGFGVHDTRAGAGGRSGYGRQAISGDEPLLDR